MTARFLSRSDREATQVAGACCAFQRHRALSAALTGRPTGRLKAVSFAGFRKFDRTTSFQLMIAKTVARRCWFARTSGACQLIGDGLHGRRSEVLFGCCRITKAPRPWRTVRCDPGGFLSLGEDP